MIITGGNNSPKYHTMLSDVIPTLHGYHIPLTWMLTDIECGSSPEALQTEDTILITGQELDKIIQDYPNLQIIWGVLSGFRLPVDEIDLSISPKAESSDVWESNYQIQHPQAECELVAWDSTATFFRSLNNKVMHKFSRRFPQALSLTDYHNKIANKAQ